MTAKKSYPKEFRQSSEFTFARQLRVSPLAKRILALALALMKDNDFKPYYQIHISDVIANTPITKRTAYEEVKKSVTELLKQVWHFENKKEHHWIPKQVLQTVSVGGIQAGYRDGVITIIFNSDLKDILMDIGRYTSITTSEYLQLKSWYSQRMYEFLSTNRDGWWYVPITEFRTLMDCKKKYKGNTLAMIQKVLSEPLTELKKTDLEFKYEIIIGDTPGPGRPKIIALRFDLINPKVSLSSEEELERMCAGYDDKYHRLIFEVLINRWKADPATLLKHIQDIGHARLWELQAEWQMREGTSNQIRFRDRHTNAVLKKEGEAARIRKSK